MKLLSYSNHPKKCLKKKNHHCKIDPLLNSESKIYSKTSIIFNLKMNIFEFSSMTHYKRIETQTCHVNFTINLSKIHYCAFVF